MTVSEKQIAFEMMQFMRPAQRVVGAKLQICARRNPVIREISITRQDRAWPREIRSHAGEVTEVLIFERRERGREKPSVRRTNQDPRCPQLAGQSLEVPEAEIKLT